MTLNINGKPRDIPDDLLIAVVQAALERVATASNDIDADLRADVNDSQASPHASFVPCQPLGGLAPGALRRVREYIGEHLTEGIATDTLARIAGLSTGHFNRAFRQSTGDSPHHYIIQNR